MPVAWTKLIIHIHIWIMLLTRANAPCRRQQAHIKIRGGLQNRSKCHSISVPETSLVLPYWKGEDAVEEQR